MGFGQKWISWIRSCLISAKSSVLINGSPTEEFPIQRGLRQGDPMAPFLFSIAMEGLHIAIDNLVSNGLFSGAKLNQITVSHLFYADDVIVVGKWSRRNLKNLSNALRFFYSVSGLKINFEKSSIIGVGASTNEVNLLASLIGCKVEHLPFKYLGIPIGGCSKRVSTWEPIINKFSKRLAGWKANLLSIGGRSTLISSVLGSLGNYFLSIFRLPKSVNKSLESMRASFFWGGTPVKRKMHWIDWGSVLAGRDVGGIGIGSLNAMNVALLYKWRWRGLISPESMWVRVVSDIHGSDCFKNMSAKSKGLWSSIMDAVRNAHDSLSLPRNVIDRKIGNGKQTNFWKDIWCGNIPFETRFPRLFAIDQDKDCSVHSRRSNSSWFWNWRRPIRSGIENEQFNQLNELLPDGISDADDTWVWYMDGKSHFSVANARRFFDYKLLPKIEKQTRWNKKVPKKINLFVWRLLRNGIPTHVNLFGRGINIDTVRCYLCSNGYDDVMHLQINGYKRDIVEAIVFI
ncbi:hypothetical protein OROGR_021407 [Orobanche gracilis]